jgi:hemolysin III
VNKISCDYDRAEIIADGVVHAIGVCLGPIGVKIVGIAVNIERIEIAPILVYVIGRMLAYLQPVSRTRR